MKVKHTILLKDGTLEKVEPATDVRGYESLRKYYLVVLALCRGGPGRPRLPLEIVQYTCWFAEFIDPKSLAVVKRQPSEFAPLKKLHRSFYMRIPQRLFSWLQLPALPSHRRSQVESVNLGIHERVKGRWYNTDPDRFFFRIISSANPEIFKTRADGSLLTWSCFEGEHVELHSDTVEARPPRVAKLSRKHEIWAWLEEGDAIEVAVLAYKWEFEHLAYDGRFEVKFWWKPSGDMLKLV